jgi:putative ABC transport system permease protein
MARRDRDADLTREIEQHLALEAEERHLDGASEEDARRAALRAFGSVARTSEDARAVWTWAWLQDALRDLRYAVRVFARTPVFTVGAILVLALGIGATTAIFGAINAVILTPLPYPEPDRLVALWQTNASRGIDRFSVSLPLYRDWRDRSASWTSLAAMKDGSVTLRMDDTPERVDARFITANALQTFGARVILGRAFLPEEDARAGAPVVLVSEAFWRRRLHASRDVLGETIDVDGRERTVTGVVATDLPGVADAPILLPLTPFDEDRRGLSSLDVYGRLRPGVDLDEAAAEMTTLARRIAEAYPVDHAGWSVQLAPLGDVVVGSTVRQRLFLLLAAAGVLLLIACLNLSSLLLVRAASRTREMAVRAALGGGRGRIVRQLLVESGALAVVGGLIGVAIAYAGMQVLRGLAMADLPRADRIGLDSTVLWFACGMSLLTGVIAGLAPARYTSRLDIQQGLHERSPATMGPSRRVRNALLVGQIALSIVLLATSGLMLRTLNRLNRVDLGFTSSHVLTAQVAPRTNAEAFFATLVARVRHLPGVAAVGATSGAPMTSGNTSLNVYPSGPARLRPTESVQADYRSITAGYFDAMETPLLAGRDFTPHDDARAPKVVIVNETLAHILWGDASPIGKRVDLGGGGGEPATVIGLARDVRGHNPAIATGPTYYVSAYRFVWGPMTLVIRTTTGADRLVPLIRTEVRAIDPALPVFGVRTMDEIVSRQVAPQRLLAMLLAAFATLALVLVVAGVYGVTAYATGQRTREIGIRLALGAQRHEVLTSLLREGAVLVACGVAIGLALTVPVARLMQGFLSGVAPSDPVSLVTAALVLAATTLIACYLPARRATRVNPMLALRGD